MYTFLSKSVLEFCMRKVAYNPHGTNPSTFIQVMK